ncbi:MAG TPA: LysM peptidoglycan-binding domain-containing protein [bacterium]|nr:LysM peptidoglycan-binding domain-containing protein [bacterium]
MKKTTARFACPVFYLLKFRYLKIGLCFLLITILMGSVVLEAKEINSAKVERKVRPIEKLLQESKEALNKKNIEKAKEKCDLGMESLLKLKKDLEREEYDYLLGEFALLRLKINQNDKLEVANIKSSLFPLVWNARVEKWIDYYTVRDRKYFSRSLKRSEQYIPRVKEIFREASLPEDLAYVAIVESGYYPFAHSPKRAVGHWQFIKHTARANGLEINYWYDERRDPEKSARAAARELKDLYERFGSWELALAGYNCGRYRVAKAINKAGTRDYWALSLPRETENYVPKIMAAIFIIKEPEIFGFTLNLEEQPSWAEVTINGSMDLRLVAQCAESSLKEIQELNPELRQLCTPPDKKKYTLKLPPGKKGVFLKNLALLPEEKRYLSKKEIKKRKIIVYMVKKGDTLSRIAHRQRVSVWQLKKWNNLKSDRIYPRQRIKIYPYRI